MAKKLKWFEAAEVLGISVRQMSRRKERWERQGYDGLFDRRLGKPSPKRVAVSVVEEVLRLYQEQYYDFNVKHFHEKLKREHHIKLSYTWVKRCKRRVWCRGVGGGVSIANGVSRGRCQA